MEFDWLAVFLASSRGPKVSTEDRGIEGSGTKIFLCVPL